MVNMATLTKASGLGIRSSNVFSSMSASVTQIVPRRAGREAARGLSTLSHAIEYLSERYVESDGSASDQKGLLDATHLLMTVHQRVYSGAAAQGEGMHEPFWARILAG